MVWVTAALPAPTTQYTTRPYFAESNLGKTLGLTTLCDGYPRAAKCIVGYTLTSAGQYTLTSVMSSTGYWILPTWTTETSQIPIPTCTVAPDLSPLCARVAAAYQARVSNDAQNKRLYAPGCTALIKDDYTGSAKPKCSFHAESYDGYIWPAQQTAAPGTFCPNNTATTATSTGIEGPSTVVTSGLTITSPDVYHLIHNATVYKYLGIATAVGYDISESFFQISTTYNRLSFSQPPSSLYSQTQSCGNTPQRREVNAAAAQYCKVANNPDFRIQDLFTVDADKYSKWYNAPTRPATICQNRYTEILALPYTDIEGFKNVATDCNWTWTYGSGTTQVGPVAATFSVSDSASFHAITATSDKNMPTGAPSPPTRTGLHTVAVRTAL